MDKIDNTKSKEEVKYNYKSDINLADDAIDSATTNLYEVIRRLSRNRRQKQRSLLRELAEKVEQHEDFSNNNNNNNKTDDCCNNGMNGMPVCKCN